MNAQENEAEWSSKALVQLHEHADHSILNQHNINSVDLISPPKQL